MRRAEGRRQGGRDAVLGTLALAVVVTGGLVLPSGASAHHPAISASARCGPSGPLVSWTSRSWITYDDPHAYNYDVEVDVRFSNGVWQKIGHGEFVKENSFQFSGTYALPSSITSGVSLRTIARGPFGPHGEFGAVGESRTTTVDIPTNCSLPTGTTCGGTLGRAADYNLFVHRDAALRGADVEGRVAIGGHLDVTAFGIGRTLTPDSSRIDLAVGGTIGADAATVHNGSVTYGAGTVSGVTTPKGVISTADGRWIGDEFTPLTASTQTWANAPANGQVVFSAADIKTMELIGTNAKTNVFSVSAADLATVHVVHVQVPANATVLVNVSGGSYSTAAAPLSAVQFWDGSRYTQFAYPSSDPVAIAYRTQMLWNFYQAATVELGGLSWEGSVLAPYASVSLTGGQLNGALIADVIAPGPTTTTELHPFRAAVSCLPAPPGTRTDGGGGGSGDGGGGSGGDGGGGSGGGGGSAGPAPGSTTPPPVVASYCGTFGTLAGSVFEDHNANGTRDGGGTAVATDRGLADVVVTAIDAAGATVGTASSGADGTYKMDITRAASKYLQVRFSHFPAGYQPGARTTSGSATQFVRLCNDKVDLALQIPSHYCQDNPDLAATCAFRASNGSLAVRTQKWSAGWNAAAGSFAPSLDAEYGTGYPDAAGGNTGNPVAIAMSQVGSVNGLAWRPASRSLYAAAFVKADSPIGPGGAGAIYRVDVAADGSGSAPTVAATLPPAAIGHPNLDPNGQPATFADAGRTGLADLVVVPGNAAADDTLYVVALGDRRLYALRGLDGTPSTTPIDLPLSLPGAAASCAAADVRPGAVTQWAGDVYVGLTCTAESTGNPAQLTAYVYRYRPGAGFDQSPALEFPLGYDRSVVETWTTTPGTWGPWSDDPLVHHNQAWLTGLAIAEGAAGEPGDLIVALRSRAGDTDDATSNNVLSEGDLLIAHRANGGWAIETDLSTTPQAEYFTQDRFPWTGTAIHLETTRGSIATVPGFRDVAVEQLTDWYAGGIAWQNIGTGRIDRAMTMYSSDTPSPRFQGDTFGKANGLGDLVALCDQAPIQIGDRVWSDVNDDGIQQAGELGLKGVRVDLRQNGTVVATSTTNGVGAYSFPGLRPNTEYQLVIDTAQTTVGSTQLSRDRRGQDPEVDSDAVARDENGHHYAVIDVTTGPPGANDLTLDFGFVRPNGVEDPCATSCAVESEQVTPPPAAGPPPTYFNP